MLCSLFNELFCLFFRYTYSNNVMIASLHHQCNKGFTYFKLFVQTQLQAYTPKDCNKTFHSYTHNYYFGEGTSLIPTRYNNGEVRYINIYAA